MSKWLLPLCAVVAAFGCATSENDLAPAEDYSDAPFFVEEEVKERIASLPYLSGEQLYQNLLRLVYVGEPAIPQLIEGLDSENPRTRGSCGYVLGVLRDRRTIEPLRESLSDDVPEVRYEIANSLCSLGERSGYPVLIDGLSDDSIRNRYKAHESLKLHTKLDFGYRHDDDPAVRRVATAKWVEWWKRMSASAL